jgi:hypothetical protein
LRVDIEVALGAWINRYVSSDNLPLGTAAVEGQSHVFLSQIEEGTTPEFIVQQLNIPLQELGVMLFGNQRVYLDTQLMPLASKAFTQNDGRVPRLWLYPQIIGG